MMFHELRIMTIDDLRPIKQDYIKFSALYEV